MAEDTLVTDEEVQEPAGATHGAEDQAWATGGQDGPHLEDEVKRLREDVARLEAELKAANDKRLRALADYDNLQRRVAQERADDERRAAARALERLLEPVEILERAVAAEEATGQADPKGLRMALERFQDALKALGLEPVPGLGAPFDARYHQAVMREPDAAPEGTVIGVVRQGYTVGGRLLREALVKVSSGPDA